MTQTVLGLEFWSGRAADAVQAARGLCVFPSAPGLATLGSDARYASALASADVRFVDSGFLTLMWFFISGEHLTRISGLRFLEAFLASGKLKSGRSLWVHPSVEAKRRNQEFLKNKIGLNEEAVLHWVAPMYPVDAPIEDVALLNLCRGERPDFIVLNLGSNTQEPLGAYLKTHLDYVPTILCTGGAIDFLTGAQVAIPTWADRLFLGWLFRILGTSRAQASAMKKSPRSRYLEAFRLAGLLFKNRRRAPKSAPRE